MKQQFPSIAVAAFILACIVFGGSTQSNWTNLGLQLASVVLIAWAAAGGVSVLDDRRAKLVDVLLISVLVLVLVQLAPLPAAIWTRLPGRGEIAEGLAALGYPPREFSIALMPSTAVLTLFAAVPAIAIFIATEHLSPSHRGIAMSIVAGMLAAVFVGAVQVAGGPGSWAYFYEVHSAGAIGFFANGNHMGTLLLVSIPMIAALVVSPKIARRKSSLAHYGVGAVAFALVIVGIFLNGSRAALALSLPVTLASVSLFPSVARWRWPALAVSTVALFAGVAVILSNPLAASELNPSSRSGIGSRGAIWTNTLQAAQDNFPVGTGLGTFESVYHRYENPAEITRSYVNHAHNDYLELALELGAVGILFIALFLLWWLIAAAQIWRSAYSTPFTRAATITSAIVLVQSIVDFPLRTAAISAIFAAAVGIMTQHFRLAVHAEPGELRATRHVRLG